MSDVFADTAGWGAYLSTRDPSHARAVTACRLVMARGDRLVSTNYVLGELVALLTQRERAPRARVLQWIEDLKASVFTVVLHVDEATDEAWTLLRARPDKAWSLVDAASFVVMRRRGLTEALTTDHHFSQAGFTRPLAG